MREPTEHDGAVLVAGVNKVAYLNAGGRSDGRWDGDLEFLLNFGESHSVLESLTVGSVSDGAARCQERSVADNQNEPPRSAGRPGNG